MSRSISDDYERREPGRCYGVAKIGVFDRAVRQPDEELMAAEEHSSLADQVELFLFMNKFFVWALVPYNPARVWGFIFAFDWDGFILGRSMAAVARELGLSRASISNAAVEVTKAFGMPPSRSMRSKKTAQRSKRARLRFALPVENNSKEKGCL